MLTIGIDVGLTGALAILDDHELPVAVLDLPVAVHRSAKWIDGAELLSMLCEQRGGRPARAVVEQTQMMGDAKRGTKAATSKGMTTGSVLATLQIASIAIELVQPGVWKRALGLIAPNASDTERKHASLSKARMLFPTARDHLERAMDHGRAEALLIAHWAVRHQRADIGRAA